MKKLAVILGLLFSCALWGQIMGNAEYTNDVFHPVEAPITKEESIELQAFQKRMSVLSDPTKSLLKVRVTDSNGKEALFDWTITNAKVKLTSTNNDSIIKKTNRDGVLLMQAEEGMHQIEVSYNLYKYKDTLFLKKAYYNKLDLQFDSQTKTLIKATKSSVEYSKIDLEEVLRDYLLLGL